MSIPSLAAALCTWATAALLVVPPSGGLRINEFMASNVDTLLDADGDPSDWIELHNGSGSSIQLGGCFLTDDPLVLTKWAFPAVSLAANKRLVVFASDKADPPAGQLHTNFKLSAVGEYLALVDSDGTTILSEFGPTYPPQYPDISYGLVPDPQQPGQFVPRYFASPTPGASNGTGYAGVVEDTDFSSDRGYYDSPISVTITALPPTAAIRYTTDGSQPTESYGTLYTGPVAITSTTVLRAMAFQPDWLSTNVDTHSYLFAADILTQPAVVPGYPNKSYDVGDGSDEAVHDYEMDPEVVNDPAYASDVLTGLTAIPTLALATDVVTMFGRSGFHDGNDVEVPCSVEVIHPDEPLASHQFDAGIEGHSHLRLKRSLRLNFRAEYGDPKWQTDLLQRALLGGSTAAGSFDRVILRAGNNRSWARNWNPDKTAYTIDELYRGSQLAASGYAVRGTFVHLYINGLYWGLYNVVERADKFYQAEYFGGDPDDWFARNHSDELTGDSSRFDYLVDDLVEEDLSQSARYAELQQYLDVPAFCDYVLLAFWSGLDDWPWNNWYAANRNASSPLGVTPVRFFAWDGEWSWNAPKDIDNDGGGAHIHPDFESDESVGGSDDEITRIWHGARANPDFMMTFADRAFALTRDGGALSDAVARARWAALNDGIRDAVVDESARWGDSLQSLGEPLRTRDDDWQRQVDTIDATLDGNAQRLLDALRDEGFYPTVEPPGVNHPGGVVGNGFTVVFDMPPAQSTVWFTLDGSDPRAPGGLVAPTALNALRFLQVRYVSPSGNLSAVALTPVGLELPIQGLTHVKARTKYRRHWSPLLDVTYTPSAPRLRLTELMYHPGAPSSAELAAGFSDADDFEFVELTNVGNDAVSLAGVAFTEGVTFAFGGGSLAPGASLVLVNNAAGFAQRYPSVPIGGVYSGKLSNSGESLRLLGGDGQTVHAFTYSDSAPWPLAADGGGAALQVVDTEGDYSDPANWVAGPPGGTPGH